MKDKGLLLRPTPDGDLDMFVDADFTGRWHKEYSHLHENVLSCTGFVITFVVAPSHGAVNSKLKLPYLQQRASTLPYLLPQEKSYL